ncbi:MAG: carboxypeptidase regulatory-like domain-containing protein [Vicinamibacterales bacterium]
MLLSHTAGAVQSGRSAESPRDPALLSGLPPVSAARLSGRVTAAGYSQRPLRRAMVQLGTGNLQTARWTSTNDNGEWAFANVSPGTYTVSASKDGYVSMGFGQRKPFGPAMPINVTGTGARDDLNIILPAGGVITGRITDDAGEPTGGALVQAQRLTFVDGHRALSPAASSSLPFTNGGLTDDRGEYRIYGLPAGTYYVSATDGHIVAGQSDDRARYATSYYPGTPSVSEARSIQVVPGESASATFGLSLTTVTDVSGQVVNAAGEPVPASLRLEVVAAGHALEVGSRLSAAADRSGFFVIKGVPGGEYFLQARGIGPNPEFAAVRVTVAGQDLRDLLITTKPGGSAAGRLLSDGPSADLEPGAFIVVAVPVGPGAMAVRLGASTAARPNPGGVFTISGIAGRHLFRLLNAPPGWALKSVTIAGADVIDLGYEFGGGQTVPVEVMVSRQMATISGVVIDGARRPVPEASVVAFSPDETKWGPRTRYIATTSINADGSFQLAGLPPGDYVCVAVSPLEAGDETDPARLTRWKSTGVRLSVRDGDSRVTLTITP